MSQEWIENPFGMSVLHHANDAGPSESQVHTEHRDALDATVLNGPHSVSGTDDELVLELESGQLRLRTSL